MALYFECRINKKRTPSRTFFYKALPRFNAKEGNNVFVAMDTISQRSLLNTVPLMVILY